MTTPRCPFCNAQGINQIEAKTVGYYGIIYCKQCGAIHGVVPVPAKPATETTGTTIKVKPQVEVSPGGESDRQKECLKTAPIAATAKAVTDTRRAGEPEWVELGFVDLRDKAVYSPEKIAARMRAMGQMQGTQYRRVAIDSGPPICVQCREEMKEVSIPAGYPNEGERIWVCPNYRRCKQWERAE
jgi:hypothetical protein